MLVDGRGGAEPEVHDGFVVGRYRDGAWSDRWTEVHRCAEGTFTDYAPACRCGWRGPVHPPTAEGHLACRRLWVFDHGAGLEQARPLARTVAAH
ncbi:MAG: hypothetical protein QOH17_21 [Pseudonocardiales bacterium]|jgi:hypothetical protein|nr:hypothetical protein [Pseudonocardiales bacterium]MDT7573688.1 hypothetical protein [Pseudonocardiales bacterium]